MVADGACIEKRVCAGALRPKKGLQGWGLEELTCNIYKRKRVAKQSRGKDWHRRLGRGWVLRLRLDLEGKETARCAVVGLS